MRSTVLVVVFAAALGPLPLEQDLQTLGGAPPDVRTAGEIAGDVALVGLASFGWLLAAGSLVSLSTNRTTWRPITWTRRAASARGSRPSSSPRH